MENRPLVLLWPAAVLVILVVVLVAQRRQGRVGPRAFAGYLIAIVAVTAVDVGFVLS